MTKRRLPWKDKKSKAFSKNTFSRGNSFLFGHRDFLFGDFLFWNFLSWNFLFWNFLWYFWHFKDRVLIFKTTKSKLGHWTSKIRHMSIKYRQLNEEWLKKFGFERESVPLAGGASFLWTGAGTFSSGIFFGTLKILGALVRWQCSITHMNKNIRNKLCHQCIEEVNLCYWTTIFISNRDTFPKSHLCCLYPYLYPCPLTSFTIFKTEDVTNTGTNFTIFNLMKNFFNLIIILDDPR